MSDIIECIYCDQAGPSSREHVLQASLGGNLTARFVCTQCNVGFSRIDQALAEQSFVSHARAVHTPARSPVRLGSEHFMYDDEHDVWQEVHVRNQLSTYVPPQFHFRLPLVWFFGSDRREKHRFVERLRALVLSATTGSIRRRIGPVEHCTTVRLVQHRSDDLFVRAATHDAADELLRVLTEKWGEFEPVLESEPKDRRLESPTVQVHLSVGLDDCNRAIAKIAFNLLALKKGVDFARRSEFRPIRDFIRGIDIRPQSLSEADVAFDRRFVAQLDRRDARLVPTTEHLVILGYVDGRVFANVILYGDYAFLVWLGDIEFATIMDFLPVAHEFRIDRSSNRAVDMFELAERIQSGSNRPR